MCNLKSCIRSWFHVHDAEHMRKGLAGTQAGASIPLRQWCISPCFRFQSCSRKNFSLVKIFSNFTFSEKNFNFYRPKFLMIFFSHQLQICNFPRFSGCFSTFLPYFGKITLSPPTFANFLLSFRKIYVLFTYFLCCSFPTLLWPWCIYASHNTFIHVGLLDAPAHKTPYHP